MKYSFLSLFKGKVVENSTPYVALVLPNEWMIQCILKYRWWTTKQLEMLFFYHEILWTWNDIDRYEIVNTWSVTAHVRAYFRNLKTKIQCRSMVRIQTCWLKWNQTLNDESQTKCKQVNNWKDKYK